VFDIKTNKPIYQDPPPTVTGCKAVRRLNDLLRRTRMYMDQAQKLLCPTNLYFEEIARDLDRAIHLVKKLERKAEKAKRKLKRHG
jgi:hypothetical protein